MAAGNGIRYLQEETTCAVCLYFFQDPVMILNCGHNFCRRCLSRCAAGRGPCPQCWVPFPLGGFRRNRQLPNVVAAVQELAPSPAQELCHSHHQPLALFCHRDGALVCTACAEQRPSPAVPLEEAARWCREQFEPSLKTLQEEDERRAGLTEAAKETRQEILTQVNGEKQKLLAMLKGLRRVLSDQESQFLSCLHRLCWRLEEQQRGEAAEMTWIWQCCAELQAKCQQLDGDLLRDTQTTLSRCTERKVQSSLLLMPELEAKLEDFTQKTNLLAEAVTQFKDILESSLEEDSRGIPESHTLQHIEVALDYAGGSVAFCDADSQTEIFAFPPATFAGLNFPHGGIFPLEL